MTEENGRIDDGCPDEGGERSRIQPDITPLPMTLSASLTAFETIKRINSEAVNKATAPVLAEIQNSFLNVFKNIHQRNNNLLDLDSKKDSFPHFEISDSAKVAVKQLLGRASRRNRGALIRNSFLLSENNLKVPTLSHFSVRGGRGMSVALKLYLSLLLLSAKPPYDTNLPSRAWAEILDLEDPELKGAQRIRNATIKLKKLKLIETNIKNGKPTEIILLKEDGSGNEYSLPTGKERYFAVPNEMWENGYIQNLNLPGLIMLLILQEEARGKPDKEQWWSDRIFKERFHISLDLKNRGIKELKEKKLITVKRVSISGYASKPNPLAQRRYRNTYKLNI